MADLEVARGSALDTFLRSHDVQPWRIQVLLDCGAVKVFREGVELPLKKGPTTHVDPGDIVRVADPSSSSCVKRVQDFVNTEARDYAFVPGDSKYDKEMSKLMDTRPRTIRVKAPIHTLEQFASFLAKDRLATNPIDRLIVASHANDEGQLKITLGLGSPKFIEYEDLEAALKSKALFLNREWFLPRPADEHGQPRPFQLLIKGCRIGTQQVFLEKLREALGGAFQVIAPKHFEAVDPQTTRPIGHKEYMSYSFAVTSPVALKTKDAVIKALTGAGHMLIDEKTPVSEKQWQAWVPTKPEAKYEQHEYTSVRSPLSKKPVKLPRIFRFKARALLAKAEKLAIDKSITTDAERLKVLKALLGKREEYKPSHSYPMYTRLGYETFDKFIEGWTWTFDPRGKPVDEVTFNAKRFEYTVIQPITDLQTGTLFLNFYPTSKKDEVIEMLDLNNTAFFGIA